MIFETPFLAKAADLLIPEGSRIRLRMSERRRIRKTSRGIAKQCDFRKFSKTAAFLMNLGRLWSANFENHSIVRKSPGFSKGEIAPIPLISRTLLGSLTGVSREIGPKICRFSRTQVGGTTGLSPFQSPSSVVGCGDHKRCGHRFVANTTVRRGRSPRGDLKQFNATLVVVAGPRLGGDVHRGVT